MRRRRKSVTLLRLFSVLALPACAQEPIELAPVKPFRVTDNVYFVGTDALGIFLITTPQGHVLVNSGYEATVPVIRRAVERLGFEFSDIRILLASHAHNDHVAGSATIKRMTGASYMVMDADVPAIESGGATDFHYGEELTMHFPITKVDRVLHDGDTITLGDTRIVAHITPGHTKGATTFTLRSPDRGVMRDVLILSAPNVNPGYRLVGNTRYPSIVEDYERSFRVLKTLPCEVFLAAHGSQFDLEAKLPRLVAGDSTAFVDPDGCREFLADREQVFTTELARQRRP